MRPAPQDYRHRPRRRLTTAVMTALMVTSCAGDDEEPAAVDPPLTETSTTETPSTQPATATIAGTSSNSTTTADTDGTTAQSDNEIRTSGVPRVEEGPCPAGVPTGDRVRCLTLIVPESRGVAAVDSDRLVRLPVAIIAAREPGARLADPVLWIDYGAGDGWLPGRARLFTDNVLSLNDRRDVITLDLRGSGLAEPSLACQEVTELNRETFGPEVDETSPDGRAMRLDAIERCHDRLVDDGVDLSAYGSDASARDLEDLRVALGIERWNIVAGEYGGKLAQVLARDYPDGLRSVLINATPVPLQADWFADLAPNAARAWSALVKACAADAGCTAAYPDLDERLDAYVTDLIAHPQAHDEVQLDGGGPRVPFLMTASRLLAYVRYYARANEYFYQVPFSIAGPPGGVASVLHVFDPDDPDTLAFQATDHYAAPDRGVWQPFPQGTSSDGGSFSLGAHLSAVCRDEAPFTDPARLTEAANTPLFGPFLGNHGDLEACSVWDVQHAAPDANQPVTSDVPFLVLAGEFDTVSSPAWADAFADGLDAATVVHFASTGTQPTSGPESTAQACAQELRGAFLDDPTEALDNGCASTSRGSAFELP